MRIFISAGEPSGDVHGANLMDAFRRSRADLQFTGFGGQRMEGAGCQLLYPLCQLSVMWFARVLAKAPTFLSLISQTDRYFRHQRPDAVVLIDYPGFNWWVARRAHFHGIPVFYFVPPQIWAWFNWRVKKMQHWVDHVLCTLPFETEWYRERGVEAHFVGHPYFDELHRQQLDDVFVQRQSRQGGTVIGLLPGSRTQEIENNFTSMVRAAQLIHQQRPEARFVVACYKKTHTELIRAKLSGKGIPVEICVGKTPEVIAASHSCIAVSGSVGLELLFQRKPSVVLYRIGKLDLKVGNYFKTSPYISLVNLLAEAEIFPEYLVDRCPAQKIADHIVCWLDEPGTYRNLQQALSALCNKVAQPGACDRAAGYILNAMSGEQNSLSITDHRPSAA